MDNISSIDEIQNDSWLLRLDDFLLSDIIKSLHITDVVNVAETCKRLSILAKRHIEKQRLDIVWNKHDNPDFKRAEKFYRYVGKSVRIVKLLEWTDSDFYRILMLLAKTCPNIDELHLNGTQMVHFHFRFDDSVMSLFSKLKRFEMHHCFWIGWLGCPLDIFFGTKSKLQVLVVNGHWYNYSNYQLPIQLTRLRTLKKLQLADCIETVYKCQLQGCFENNTITELSLANVASVSLMEGHLIEGLINTVESLTMDIDRRFYLNLDNLLKLRKLRKLRLVCQTVTAIDEFLSKLGDSNKIEELEVTKIIITIPTIEALSKFKKLTKLNFDVAKNSVESDFFESLPKSLPNLKRLAYTNSVINDESFIYIIKSMPNLKVFNLLGCNRLELKTYLKMTDTINASNRLAKLQFVPPRASPAILKYLESAPLVVRLYNRNFNVDAESDEYPNRKLTTFTVKFLSDASFPVNSINRYPLNFLSKYKAF